LQLIKHIFDETMLKANLPFYYENKNVLLLRVTCLFWLLAKLLSWRIWTTRRLLPAAPLFQSFDHIPAAVHTGLFILSIFLLLFLLFKANKTGLIALLGVEIILCLLDQSRLLPWEYQFIFTILIFLINAGKPASVPACIAFLLVSTYFYGGISKLNDDFVQTVWNVLILKFFFRVSPGIIAQSWMHYSGYLLGIIELLAGVGLLFKNTQVRSALILIGMHLFILLLFSPVGYRGYRVLWPWNSAMILFLYFIFIKEEERIAVIQPVIVGWNKLTFIFWGILPALSFIGYWDYNLSSNLFSGNAPKMMICVTDTSACKPLQRFCYKNNNPGTCTGQAKIDIQNWAISETGVSAYPEMRVYKTIEAKLLKQYPAAGLTFIYFTHSDRKAGGK